MGLFSVYPSAMKYSGDFYMWLGFCWIPSFGFIYTLINKRSRPWAVKAIEDSDDKPHQVDLTFVGTWVAGWIVANGLFAGMGLYLFEGIDTLSFCRECVAVIVILWGVKTIAHKFSR